MTSEGSTGPRKALFYLLMFCATLAAMELTARFAFQALPGFERTRAALRGELGEGPRFQRCVGQAYLLYVPSPSYSDEHGLQHNADGYRGPPISLERTQGAQRVLFLGGSTTYGWKIRKPEDTYPAQLGELLGRDLPPGVSAVEVINAGLPWGTTAEMFTHYHFKFHYYRPDVVVINTGANDAMPALQPGYQPDYSHWRQPLAEVPVLAPLGRMLLRSRLLSAVLIPAYAGLVPNRFSIAKQGGADIPWAGEGGEGTRIPDPLYGFRHNLERLVAMVNADGARVVLVPWRGKPGTHPEMRGVINRNEVELRFIAGREGVQLAPFPDFVVSPENWADRGHVNAAGALEKANHVLPYVQEALAAQPTTHSGRKW